MNSPGASKLRNRVLCELEPGVILTPFERRAHLINRELLRRGETQLQLAQQLGISGVGLFEILDGRYRGRRETLLKIAELLILRPNDLLVSWQIDCDPCLTPDDTDGATMAVEPTTT